MLAQELQAQLAKLPLFESIDGSWLAWSTLRGQLERFGDLWSVPRVLPGIQPLDDRRLVIVLEVDELALARRHDSAIIDARVELALDHRARANREREVATSLALPAGISVLAQITLDGDGITQPRGTIGVLAPEHAEQRALHAHREMFPFDPGADVCDWPTIAVVDDARLTPDRVWAAPIPNGAPWNDIITKIRAASEHMLHGLQLLGTPEDALVSRPISRAMQTRVPALRDQPEQQVRGTLWLAGPPGHSEIAIRASARSTLFLPGGDLGMRGTLLVHAQGDPLLGLSELCLDAYTQMLVELGLRRELGDSALAHLAAGLATRRIPPEQTPHVLFACFRPAPLGARELVALFGAIHRVPIIDDGVATRMISIVDDGSFLARTVIARLGPRARRERPIVVPAIPAIPTAAPKPPPRPVHWLDIVVEALRERIARCGIVVPSFAIAPGTSEPMLELADHLVLAGEHPQLHAIAAACHARSACADAALDVLAAHAVTVLNVGLTEVTDAAEAAALGMLLAEC
ncbi:MAG: hypothetical protein WKG01_22995 [Kofleriaceae bacterium]